jgi:hypothetical protein
MAVTITSYTNAAGEVYKQTAVCHLLSSVSTSQVIFPPHFQSDNPYISYGFLDNHEDSFTSSLASGVLSMDNTTTNPIRFIVSYEPFLFGSHHAEIVFTEYNTGEKETLTICAEYTPEGILLDIIDSKTLTELSLVDGISTARIDELDGVSTFIVI